VLLDLQIPIRFGQLPCIEFGAHLARDMHLAPAMQGVPIIVMTAYGKDGLEIAASLCGHGVVEFINKPFPQTGRTLASVIQAVLERTSRKREQGSGKCQRPDKPFQGGELVVYPDRAELCGVAVVSNSKSCQMWTILCALTQRLENGRYKALDGNALSAQMDGDGGQGSVAGRVRDFRRHLADELGRELGFKFERDDVIETSKSGYRLNARITVKDLRGAMSLPTTNGHLGADDSGAEGSDNGAHERRERILTLVRGGERLRVPGFAEKMRCSYTTAKREIDALKDEGHIEFVGAAKTGFYRLANIACNREPTELGCRTLCRNM
jgi:hypothetical protein